MLSDKIVMKQLMSRENILTPIWHKYNQHENSFHKGKYIIKPLYEHGSKFICEDCVVTLKDANEADDKIASLFPDKPDEFFAERYIESREFNTSVIEINGSPEILPMAEIIFEDYGDRPKIVCEKAKWDSDSSEYKKTVRVFDTVEKYSRFEGKLEKIVMKCWDTFNLSGYGRIDIRVDSIGEPYVLEVNANPSLAKDAAFTPHARKQVTTIKR